jgi:hypothetical protein
MRRCFLPRNCCRLMGSPVVLGRVKSGGLVPDVQRRGAPHTEQQTTQEREEKDQVSHRG